jgi:hypothetical protein
VGESGTEPISEARVESEGDYSEADEQTTIWEHSPVPLEVPANTTVKLKAEYSSPARNCVLEIAGASGAGKYKIAAQADDGCLQRTGATYPPTGTPTVWVYSIIVGQLLDGSTYKQWRGYVRFDTSNIGAGATVTGAKLRVKLSHIYGGQPWTLQVRQPAGGYDWYPLDATDWRATPGSDPLCGSLASSAFPPSGQWAEITIGPAYINKTGWTCFYLVSSRDVDGLAPAPWTEHAIFYRYGTTAIDAAELEVSHSALVPVTQVFRNYGAGADIELTAGAQFSTLYSVLVKGFAYSQGTERSLVVADAPSPPDEPNPLSVEMPHQATRSGDMAAEATRLAARHDGAVDRVEIDLEELDAASLTQMQARQINDLVTVKNLEFDHSSKVNGNFFVEGVNWRVSDQGKVLKVTLSLEAK